ncbi:hypothetical protein CAI21_15575 [Alkalilimnicola ehrlichii]|uniref:DUF2383 domain-containing protein n=1 Tax=Alkalilimnicola ehrlichii TaxID=351052 RepID=A0A3E0WMC5_9GAMM|nr:DUF2383 domain-containing protein [Alkalilimnicola ehrlichii]RFA26982.1 hypothetical protein CAI21_15575 [Alkalilimnicola ehrlichii]RFA34102.1 hypothetical protein CAL65_15710 [Alkalilimnicola ehrlichii]
MATSIGTESDPLALLTHLIELDLDAVEAYEAAIQRLDDPQAREPLEEFKAEHIRHVDELSQVVHRLGGVPPQSADLHGLLAKGKVLIANLAGERAILSALRSNEEDTVQAYERAVGRPELDLALHELLARNLEDDHRHRAWLQAKLRTL